MVFSIQISGECLTPHSQIMNSNTRTIAVKLSLLSGTDRVVTVAAIGVLAIATVRKQTIENRNATGIAQIHQADGLAKAATGRAEAGDKASRLTTAVSAFTLSDRLAMSQIPDPDSAGFPPVGIAASSQTKNLKK